MNHQTSTVKECCRCVTWSLVIDASLELGVWDLVLLDDLEVTSE